VNKTKVDWAEISITQTAKPIVSAVSWRKRVGELAVLVQPEMEKRRSPLVSIPPSGGDFQGMGSFDPMEVGRRKNESSRLRPSFARVAKSTLPTYCGKASILGFQHFRCAKSHMLSRMATDFLARMPIPSCVAWTLILPQKLF
jgi:hypothetical protein